VSLVAPKVPLLSWIALASGLLWGVGLIAFAYLAPVYQTERTTRGGHVTRGTDTLVGENGGVLVVFVVPIVATVLVGLALLLPSRRASLTAAWTLTAAAAVLNVLALLTVGCVMVPITAALVFACLAASAG
jgi:hypothetical protein